MCRGTAWLVAREFLVNPVEQKTSMATSNNSSSQSLLRLATASAEGPKVALGLNWTNSSLRVAALNGEG